MSSSHLHRGPRPALGRFPEKQALPDSPRFSLPHFLQAQHRFFSTQLGRNFRESCKTLGLVPAGCGAKVLGLSFPTCERKGGSACVASEASCSSGISWLQCIIFKSLASSSGMNLPSLKKQKFVGELKKTTIPCCQKLLSLEQFLVSFFLSIKVFRDNFHVKLIIEPVKKGTCWH